MNIQHKCELINHRGRRPTGNVWSGGRVPQEENGLNRCFRHLSRTGIRIILLIGYAAPRSRLDDSQKGSLIATRQDTVGGEVEEMG